MFGQIRVNGSVHDHYSKLRPPPTALKGKRHPFHLHNLIIRQKGNIQLEETTSLSQTYTHHETTSLSQKLSFPLPNGEDRRSDIITVKHVHRTIFGIYFQFKIWHWRQRGTLNGEDWGSAKTEALRSRVSVFPTLNHSIRWNTNNAKHCMERLMLCEAELLSSQLRTLTWRNIEWEDWCSAKQSFCLSHSTTLKNSEH